MSERRSAWCGVDIGTQGVRAAAVDAEGRVLATGTAPLPDGERHSGRHEQDPESWWAATVAALRGATTQLAGDVRIEALALDATSGTVLVEDAHGAPVGPALMYDDARAVAQAQRAQSVGHELWTALGYRMQTSWALPKVLWLRENDHVRHGDGVVHQSDHLVRRLTGHAVPTDSSHALKTGVDLRTVSWPTDLFGALDLPVALLPDVTLPGTPLGVVGVEAAAATGLPAGLPVHAGMTDGCAAQIASGALSNGAWSSALGTTLVLKGATSDLLRDPTGAVYCHRSPDGGWLPGGASSTGAGVLRQTFPDADLTALTVAAAALGTPRTVTYPLAGTGERFPFVAGDAHGFRTGASDDPAAVFSAICHGVAYVERLAYAVLGHLGADVSGPVTISGGATRNPWWNQLRADVLGRPLLLTGSVEAAVGMAVLAASPPGELASTAARMVHVEQTVEPDLTSRDDLERGYRRLVAALAERGWLDRDLADAVVGGPAPRQATP